MVAVIGVMAVGLLLSALIMSTVLGGVGFTSSARAGVQSQAASESGIAVARAGVESGTCEALNHKYKSGAGVSPAYDVDVYRPRAGGGWELGCPFADSGQVRFVSNGVAAAPGVSGNSIGDETDTEAIFSSPVIDTSIGATGPAVYAYSSTGFQGSGTLVSVDGSSPSVLIKKGNVTCNGAASTNADWVIDGGDFETTGSCNIPGNVWVSGNAIITGAGNIGKNLVAKSLTMAGSGYVGGSTWVTDGATLNWSSTINTNLTASTINFAGGDVKGMSWARGNVEYSAYKTMSGYLTAKSKSGSGTITFKAPPTFVAAGPGVGPVAPITPTVAPWVNFGYVKSDWDGFTEKVLTGSTTDYNNGGCGYVKLKAAVASFGTASGILDLRGCTGTVTFSGYEKLPIKGDLVILANKLQLAGSGGFESTGGKHKIWLIQPDNVIETPTAPSCEPPTGRMMDIGSGAFTYDPNNLSIMVFTPCRVTLGSSMVMNGQIFAGEASIAGAAKIGFVPIGLPKVNLNTGLPTEASPTGTNLTLLSIRNLVSSE